MKAIDSLSEAIAQSYSRHEKAKNNILRSIFRKQ